MKRTKEQAVTEITNLIHQITNVANSGRLSAEHTRWLHNCHHILLEIFGKNSAYFRSFAALKWYDTHSYVITIFENIDDVRNVRDHRAFLECLEMAKGIFLAAIDDINRSNDIEDVYKDKKEDDNNLIIKVLNAVNNKFRIFFHDEPRSEKDVQDNFEKLLVGCDFSYLREKERITYSSKTYIPDFVLTEVPIAIEIKICNRSDREKEIISEINDDIMAYNTKYKNSMFIIYDVGHIRDVDQFARSFKRYDNVIIVVVKH
jgi:hypothetical protein